MLLRVLAWPPDKDDVLVSSHIPYISFLGIRSDIPAFSFIPIGIFYSFTTISAFVYMYKHDRGYLRDYCIGQSGVLLALGINFAYETFLCTKITAYIPIHGFYHIVEAISLYRLIILAYCVEFRMELNCSTPFLYFFPAPRIFKSELLQSISDGSESTLQAK